MGFIASEAVEELSYDFGQYGPKGVIPEPTTKQVEAFRNVMLGSLQTLASSLGLNISDLGPKGPEVPVTLEMLDTLLEKSEEAEHLVVTAVADLTGIPEHTLNALPYRVKAAFLGYITGAFLSPEA